MEAINTVDDNLAVREKEIIDGLVKELNRLAGRTLFEMEAVSQPASDKKPLADLGEAPEPQYRAKPQEKAEAPAAIDPAGRGA